MCTILIIEDDQRLAQLLRTGIEEAGHHVLLAYDAEMALRLLKASPPALPDRDFRLVSECRAFDLVVSDIILPGMNGIELCKRIKEVMSNVPILMLTALGTTDDKLEGFDAGAEPQSDDSVCATANRYLLALAFRNLIENNCKYSPNHTSNITIHTRGNLSVAFSDNGTGMSPEERRNLFRMFYRGTAHTESGHGIGMALVQRIMSLHKANIEVQSKTGHGTKFIVRMS